MLKLQFLIFYLSITLLSQLAATDLIHRRILHQPLFPATSSPPPELNPPPDVTTFPNPDQPFFPEVPTSQTPDQSRSTLSPPPANQTAAANPIAAQTTKPVKKFAIVLSVGIVSLGMLSALIFYLYKHKSRHSIDTIKLVGPNSQNESRFQQPPPPPQQQSNFLYIGTVEPTGQSQNANGSPYRKLKSDRYRPSPELQPLPPLTKPLPPAMNSPPPMSSSDDDDEVRDQTAFYTPQDSSNSSSRRSYKSSRWTSKIKLEEDKTNTFPNSKRTSPKYRVSNSSPDSKQNPVPTSPEIRPFSRPKFSPPLPPPNMSLLRSNIKQSDQTPKTHIPPPPPPPPPHQISSSTTPRKLKPLKRESPIPSPELQSKPISVESKGRTNDEVVEEEEEGRAKLKPLHWDKVRATSDRATVWDQLKSSSFQLNEDMMESLFGCKSATPKEITTTTARRLVMPPPEQENRVLDPKKSQNIAILLRALNVTRDEVSEALLAGNPEGLGVDLLETLVKMAPTKEEEIKLKDYNGDLSKLGSAERFLKGILDIPFAFKRVEAMLYRANFDAEVKYLRNSFQTLEIASEELKNSRLFLKLLEAVLQTGNRMNVGTNRGDAKAFKLETLLKLVDIKGTDGKTTLLHFVVQEIIRSEGVLSDSSTNYKKHSSNSNVITMTEEDFKKQGLRVVSGLSKELANVKQAAGMDSDVLNSYLTKLETGLVKVRNSVVMENEKQGKFFNSMKTFIEQEADTEIKRIKAEERKALSVVKDVTEYFHGDKGKVEAHPLRIFMIVRDFLSILDNVCKEVRVLQDNAVMGSARSFRLHPTASLPVLNRYNVKQGESSEDDDDSLSL